MIIAAFTFVMFFSCNNSNKETASSEFAVGDQGAIELIQFHSEHRCMTCNKIETLSREVLKAYPDIQFSLVNVDEKANEAKAEDFEAFGTSLFLYNPTTKAKKNLTEFAFMNAGNETKFFEGLKKEIEKFN